MKLLYRDKPDEMVKTVNETLDQIDLAIKRIDGDSTRLLPLVEGAPNETLANLLAMLLIEDESQAEDGARGSLMILTGIQAYQDSGGDPRVIELAWRPVIVARKLLKEHGPEAWKIAAQKAGQAMAAENRVESEMYERVAVMLQADVNKGVDNPT